MEQRGEGVELADEEAATRSLDQFEVHAWLKRAVTALADSRWRPQLEVAGVSVLDALQSECMVTLMRFAREGGAEAAAARLSLKDRLLEPARRVGHRAKLMLKEIRAGRQAPAVERSRFVVFPTEPTHVQVLGPVYDELARRGERPAYFTSRPKLWERLQGSGATVALASACWPRETAAARGRGRTQARRVDANPGVELPACPGLGTSRALVAHFRELITTYLPTVAEAAEIGRLIVERVSPEVLVVGNDVTLEGRVLVRVAHAAGIPTVTSMHGNVAGNPLHGTHLVDRMFLFGEASRRTMLAYGQAGERFVVTGPAHLDRRPRQSGRPLEAVARQLNLDPNKTLVLGLLSGVRQFFSRPHHLLQVEALARASVEFPSVQVVAKLHRVDEVKYYDEVRRQVPGAQVQVVPYAAPGFPVGIYDWLQGCRLVLTGASTAAVEAMLMDVPVITMDLCDELRGIDFIEAGATLHCRRLDEVNGAIRAVLDDAPAAQAARRRAQAYLADCYGPLDGQAAVRAADELEGLARLRTAQARQRV